MGPPPKVRTNVPQAAVEGVVQDEPYDVLHPNTEDSGNIALAIARQSSAIRTLLAHLTAQSGDVLGDLTAGGQASSTTKGVSKWEQHVLRTDDATTAPEATPSQTCASVRGGSSAVVHAAVPGEARRLQNSTRNGSPGMDPGSRHRCCLKRGFPPHKRSVGFDDGVAGAVSHRQGGLDFGLYAQPTRRAASASLPREVSQPAAQCSSIWATCSSTVDGGVSLLFERFGDTSNQKERDSQKSREDTSSCPSFPKGRGARPRRVAQEKAAVPEAAQSKVHSRCMSPDSESVSARENLK